MIKGKTIGARYRTILWYRLRPVVRQGRYPSTCRQEEPWDLADYRIDSRFMRFPGLFKDTEGNRGQTERFPTFRNEWKLVNIPSVPSFRPAGSCYQISAARAGAAAAGTAVGTKGRSGWAIEAAPLAALFGEWGPRTHTAWGQPSHTTQFHAPASPPSALR